MKKAGYAVIVLFSVMIAVFAVFGEEIYSASVRHVHSVRAKAAEHNGEIVFIVPESAVANGSVYVVDVKNGFEITHKTAECRKVTAGEKAPDGNVFILSGVSAFEEVVLEADKVSDGEIIIIERNA